MEFCLGALSSHIIGGAAPAAKSAVAFNHLNFKTPRRTFRPTMTFNYLNDS